MTWAHQPILILNISYVKSWRHIEITIMTGITIIVTAHIIMRHHFMTWSNTAHFYRMHHFQMSGLITPHNHVASQRICPGKKKHTAQNKDGIIFNDGGAQPPIQVWQKFIIPGNIPPKTVNVASFP